MSLRESIQIFVLRTQAYWPFSICYQALYWLATDTFARVCRRFPDVTAAYVRSTIADGTWTAGVSDIDLTVVIRSGLPPDGEYALLRKLWARYFNLRRCFPMLGEMDVLDESQIGTWLQYSRRTDSPPPRRLIAGHDVLAGRDASPDGRWRTRAQKDALWFYMDRLRPAVARPKSGLQKCVAQRIGRKILRLVNAPERTLPADSVELTRVVLSTLDRSVRSGDSGSGEPDGTSLVLDSANRRFMVGPVSMVDPAGAVGPAGAALAGDTVLLTPALFEFYVRQYDPAEYQRYVRSRNVLRGQDPMVRIAPPDAESFHAAALDQVPNVLLFPRSEHLFRPGSKSHSGEIDSAWRRVQTVLNALGTEPNRSELPHLATREEVYRHFRRSAEKVSVALETAGFEYAARTGSR